MKIKVSEVFRSIQGEAKLLGLPQVFVRLHGCNMHCSWCDSWYACDPKSEDVMLMSAQELWAEVDRSRAGCHSMCLTGGEPLLHEAFLKEFLPVVKEHGLKVHLETNGTLPAALSALDEWADIVAMDIKLPSSTGCRAYWEEHEEFLRLAQGKDVFVKAVISRATSFEDLRRAVELIAGVDDATLFFLQPNHDELGDELIAQCLSFQNFALTRLKDVRVIPQMHKFIHVR